MTEPARAQSALNLRLLLALVGFVVLLVLGIVGLHVRTAVGVVVLVLAAVALVDAALVERRRRTRAAVGRRTGERHDSLFE